MKALFIGGTGNISRACVKRALQNGWEVYLLNRGTKSNLVPEGARSIKSDIRDVQETKKRLKDLSFDVVAQFVAYVPEHIQADIELFQGRVGQYIFISSASVYHKPALHYIITESTPLHNPFWEYSRNKIACEYLLRKTYAEKGFPFTVVRPSHTYDDGWIPNAFSSSNYTIAHRMLEGKEIISHGDGQSLWTLTHSSDFAKGFVGLFGNSQAIGEAFHITSDEALSWDQIYKTIASPLGVAPQLVHIPSDTITEIAPDFGAGLLGDKAYSSVFDNSKIKRLVPSFQISIPLSVGVRRSLEWYEKHPDLKMADPKTENLIEKILSEWNGMVKSVGRRHG
jgi:nucleoside-diphosphate-sugar epimerase